MINRQPLPIHPYRTDKVPDLDSFHSHYAATGINVARVTKLFSKPFVCSGSLIVDGSDKHLERVKGMVTGTIILKADTRTKMIVGLAALVDPTVVVPVTPAFSYKYKYKNCWMADFILPQRAYMRKRLLKNGRIFLGAKCSAALFTCITGMERINV